MAAVNGRRSAVGQVRTMANKEVYIQMMEHRLRDWDAAVRQLKAKADEQGPASKVDYYKYVEALNARRLAAEDALRKLRQADDARWQQLKADMDQSWADLEDSLDRVSARLLT